MARTTLVTLAAIGLLMAGTATAGTITFPAGTNDGYAIDGEVEVTLGAGTVDFTIKNLSPFTHNAAQLLTGFSFVLDGFSSLSLTTATAPSINVDGAGIFSATTPPTTNLLTAKNGGPTWEVVGFGAPDSFFLKFNPDAKFAIIGTEEPDGDYSQSNSSIKANNGHNPFAYLEASFTLTVPGLTPTSTLSNPVLWFGTDFAGSIPPDTRIPPSEVVPLPSSAWAGLAFLLALGLARRYRRRQSRAV